jgi:calcineurin-like phosphoesterase family protein
MRFLRATARALLCWAATALVPSRASAELYRWIQYGRDGLEARAVTDGGTCPSAQIDGVPVTMVVRAPSDENFPVTACALPLPAGTRSVAIAGLPLVVPPPAPQRILVIGDTGCRIKGSYVQACNDPVQWPFRLIAEVAAQRKPDLVIHVGDYHYRETPCPAGDAGCAGSPFGDVWAVWRADFFAPAETLLRIAPWVFVRGNHEECERGGHGWSRIIAPDAFADGPGCNGPAKPFVARLPGLALAVMDVSSAREDKVDAAQADEFRRQYRGLAETSGPTWILQHRPIWSPGGVFGGKLLGDSKTLEAAAQDSLPANVTMILSGHHHLFQVLSYRTGEPAQVVVGHGGDYLNQPSLIDPATWTFGPVAVESGINLAGAFGFAMIEKQDDGWRLTDYDKLGVAVRTCTLKGRTAVCP